MSRPEQTKQLLADSLKKLVTKKPLAKISIRDITAEAGVNRQTFYYHFLDKQDLVCWIFDRDVGLIAGYDVEDTSPPEERSMLDEHGLLRNDGKILDDVIEYLYSERAFYVEALTSDVQNNLREHIYTVSYRVFTRDLATLLGARQMTLEALQTFTRFFAHAITGTLVQWAQEGMKQDHIEMARKYGPIIHEQLLFVIDQHSALEPEDDSEAEA